MNPILVEGNRRSPQLVNPTNACLAVVLPTIDGIDVKKVPISLTVGNEKVIFSSESDFTQPGIGVDQCF